MIGQELGVSDWTPVDLSPHVETVDVYSNAESVELLLNGKSLGSKPLRRDAAPRTWKVAFEPGTIKAIARKGGKVVAQQEIQTAGEPAAIRLTPITGSQGLQADGSDVALIDVEVVDAQGRRCPTDEARVDFAVSGPLVWRGGFNAAKLDSTNNLYLDTECGINRVAVRSTLTPGEITVTATRNGLKPATVKITSKPVNVTAGLERAMPPRL